MRSTQGRFVYDLRSSPHCLIRPDIDAILKEIALTGAVDIDWDELREAIRAYIAKNVLLFLATAQKPITPAPYAPITTPAGGLRLPPFVPKKSANDAPLSYMTKEEATTAQENVISLLDQFEGSPPFTIQRLCELCVEPKRHYQSVGKYLRAVEKTLLVTSTHDSFPPLSVSEQFSAGRSAIVLGSTLQSAPSTPLFSPIPFLHEDARRSKSRSPPPTPLTLNPLDLPHELDLNTTKNMGSQEPIGLGLVDEMDDPGPGHMSDHPTALSSVTTVVPPSATTETKPLQERFVKAQTPDINLEDPAPVSGEKMDVDEDKENDTKS